MLQALTKFLFGYDVFISYPYAGGIDYARKLEKQLTALDFSCFLDSEELPYGASLKPSLERAIRRSRAFILVGTRKAVTAPYVNLEVQAALSQQRTIIPIDVEGVRISAKWQGLADMRWIEESGQSEEPSTAVLAAIRHHFLYTRRNTIARRVIGGAALVFLAVALLAVWQWRLAVAQRNLARAHALAAQSELDLARIETNRDVGPKPERAVLLALESLRITPTIEGDEALRHGMSRLKGSSLPDWVRRPKPDEYVYPDKIPSVTISPDGKFRVLPSDPPEAPVILEEIGTGRSWELQHEWTLQAMHFSPDSKWICTVTWPVSRDASDPDATFLVGSTIRIWSVLDRTERTRISLAAEGGINRAVFSPDGNTLATFDEDANIRIWPLWPEQVRAQACRQLSRNLSPSEWQRFFGSERWRETCPGLPVVSE